MLRKTSILLLTFFLIFPIFPISSFAATDTVAILKEVQGEIFVLRSGGKVEFNGINGMPIRQGDSIRTGKGASVKLDFGDGNESTLGEYSKVTIAELSTIEEEPSIEQFSIMSKYLGKKVTVKKQSGRMWSKVKNVSQSGNRHKVETSTSIMGVRGTLFLTYVDPNTGQTALSVFDGMVEAGGRSNETSNNTQNVNPGEQFKMEDPFSPPPTPTQADIIALFGTIEATLGKEIVQDTIEVAEERLQQAEQTLNQLQQQAANNEEVLRALALAAEAERQARIAARTLEAASNSPRAGEINRLLQRSFTEEQQRVSQIQQRAESTRAQVDQIADESDIPEEVIREIIEEQQRMIDRISEPTEPSTGSGGGSSDDDGDEAPTEPNIIAVTGVELSHKDVTLRVGEQLVLNVTVKPENATNKAVTWSTSNPEVATIENGTIQAVGLGEAVITVTTVDGGHQAEVAVIVEEPSTNIIAVEGIEVEVTNITLPVGIQKTINVHVYPENATNREVVWETSNPSVVTVENGVIQTISVGQAIVKVTTVDGGYQAEVMIDVKDHIPAQGVKIVLDGNELSENETIYLVEGEEIQLEALIDPENASNQAVIWEINDPDVVIVNENGLVKAVGLGEAVITVTTVDGGHTAQVNIYVEEYVAIEDIFISTDKIVLIEGDEYTVIPSVYPMNASVQDLIWETNNPNVATVNDGVIEAVGLGETNITVKTLDGQHQHSVEVHVVEQDENKPVGFYYLKTIEWFNLELHWYDPATTNDIIGYDIYQTIDKTNNYEFAQFSVHLSGDVNNYEIENVQLSKYNYFYIIARYDNGQSSEPLELYIHYLDGVDNKLSQFEPSWIMNDQNYSGVQYSIKDINNLVDFHELFLDHFSKNREKIDSIVIITKDREIVLNDLTKNYYYLLNVSDVKEISVYFNANYDKPPPLSEYPIVLEGDRKTPQNIFLENTIVTSDTITFKLNDEIMEREYMSSNPFYYVSIFMDGLYVDPGQNQENIEYNLNEKTFKIKNLAPGKKYWIAIRVYDDSYSDDFIICEFEVTTPKP